MASSHNRPMESPQFADEFGRLYREALSAETTTLLSHLQARGAH